MLRVTTEALAAALGGVDSLHVAPYDEPAGMSDAFTRRIARNVQDHFAGRSAPDPPGRPSRGHWAVESLVSDLAQQAWALFQTIEAQDGLWATLQTGFIQSEIAGVRADREKNLARRKDVLVGTNQYANPSEPLPPADTTNYGAIYRERAEQLARHRDHDDDPAAHVAALERLGVMLDAPPEEMVGSAVGAALAGATLGEITTPCASMTANGR
ncbi:MAG: methylmalonyl-CoA mutase family protein [Chloroflexota bacterium]